jgi:hypothetical protein
VTTARDPNDTQILRAALFRIARDTAAQYWKPIAAGACGFILGVASLKIELADALSTARDAKEATRELREIVKELATEREVRDTNQRIDDVISLLAHAQKVAEEPPNGKQHEPRKPRK